MSLDAGSISMALSLGTGRRHGNYRSSSVGVSSRVPHIGGSASVMGASLDLAPKAKVRANFIIFRLGKTFD